MELAILFPPKSQCLMTPSIAFKPAPPLLRRLTPATFRLFATASSATTAPEPELVTVPVPSKPKPNGSTRDKKVTLDANQLKLNWLESLSCPRFDDADSRWVIGVDPDLSGALAVLKPDNSPQVYDTPHLKVLIGKRLRKRLDARSIIQLLQRVDAPIGTTVYIEQSIPYPQDGMVEWRFWIWTMDWDPGCLGVFCCSSSVIVVEE